MANISGDAATRDPTKSDQASEQQQTASPSFPNTRWMPVSTDFSRNPGTFEDVFKKIKDLMPPVFEGAKISVTKMLSSHFQVSHSMTLTSGSGSGYKFGANYVGRQLYSASEVFPVVLGDIDASGNSNAQIIHQLTDRFRFRLLAQVQSYKMAGYQFGADYRTPYTCTSLTMANVDLFSKSGLAIIQHLARVTTNIDLGAEYLYQANPMIPGKHIGITSLVAKYRGSDWYTGIKLNLAGVLNLAYFHQKTNSPLQLGVEFETSLAAKETSATFSYQYDLAKANTTFRGMVDTNGIVSAVIEKRLVPLPFTFMLSSSLNHAKSAYRFGCGLLIG